jgi:hypothetical protein
MISTQIAAMLGGTAAVGDYESIATANGTGASNTITFSSIPGTYKHLQIRGILVGTASDTVSVSYNSDTTATNYYYHRLQGTGAGSPNAASGNIRRLFDSAGSGSNYLAFVVDILDYANTNKNKTTRSLSGYDANGSGVIDFESNLWSNASTAISSIALNLTGGVYFTTASSFALYGIK